MKRLVIILGLLSILSACVFNIKIPPEEKAQPSALTETELPPDEKTRTIIKD